MNDNPAAELSERPRVAGWEWGLLAVLMLGGLLSWARYYMSFEMPNPDFFGMVDMAQAIFGLHLPGTLKRMPGYPFALGLVAMLIPGDRPFVHASMILGLACSATSLVLMFLISKRLVGRAALIPVIALLGTPLFSLMSTQTMLEAFMGMLILATFWLSGRGSQWAYATAAWATLCRQECAILVPLVWAVNLWDQPKGWLKHTAKAFVAGLPLATWMLFKRWAGQLTGGADAYVQEMAGMGWHIEWSKVWLMLEPFPDAHIIFQGPLLLLAAIGVVVGLKRWPKMALMLLGFFAFYNLVHIVFSVYRLRYAYPVLFVVPLFATAGGQWLLAWMGSITENKPKLRAAGAVVIGLMALAWAGNRWMDFGRFDVMPWQHKEDFLGLAVLLMIVLGVTGVMALRGSAIVRVGITLGIVGFATGPLLFAADVRAREQGYYDDANIRHRYAVDWIATNLAPGETAAVPRGHSLLYWRDRFDPATVYDITEFNSEDASAFFADLDRLGVDYLIKTQTLRKPTDESELNYNRDMHYYHWQRAHLSEPFRDGGEVAGFELVDTIEHHEPAVVPVEPIYIYRVVRDEIVDDESDVSYRLDQNPTVQREADQP
ncbi:hypothetical protein [Algisphaera agarilytica]|uniref:Glycosyltransferase RgtA/B/C/D-like domain-containing protein n=1 Tax=Algisphaera agarilytica TaxID=1385975 RepID=A0A7X0LLU3_9BACT|nr:hypothetical protein [Algisphaera agarilytica]MBB6430981.1 hypothetical protein [Algisphaera agarilytica]